MNDPLLIVITGPTASGKSTFAMQLCSYLKGVILNADSMQWYRDLPILTAQPSVQDKTEMPHYLYGVLDLHEVGSAALWQSQAIEKIKALSPQIRFFFIVGGTGLYLKTLTHGLSPIPPIDEDTKQKVRQLFEDMDFAQFERYVFDKDPLLLQKNPPKDKQRLTRALEVFLQTGVSIRTFQGHATPPFDTKNLIHIAISPPQDILHQHIQKRLQTMLAEGVLDEIEHYWAKEPAKICSLNQVLGLMPFTRYMNGQITKEEALEQAFIETRQYAKRQRTWLKGQSSLNTLYNPDVQTVLSLIEKYGGFSSLPPSIFTLS